MINIPAHLQLKLFPKFWSFFFNYNKFNYNNDKRIHYLNFKKIMTCYRTYLLLVLHFSKKYFQFIWNTNIKCKSYKCSYYLLGYTVSQKKLNLKLCVSGMYWMKVTIKKIFFHNMKKHWSNNKNKNMDQV